jgi:putative hydrolase of the HAD superfamily
MPNSPHPDLPKVIFLDAVGTLFGVRGTVGQVYAKLAQAHGVSVAAADLDRAFLSCYRAAPAMRFPGIEPSELADREYGWWHQLAIETFDQAGVRSQFADFDAFFAALYQHFTTAEPWVIYDDVYGSLVRWRSQGIELGVISNFDTRLHSVLHALSLDQFFASVTISTEVGLAKPDPGIFAIALAKHGCTAAEAWHIGDSRREDYDAARSAGLRGILVERSAGEAQAPRR